MKKITPIVIAAILIVISCIFIAGCVTTPAATIDKENPAYSVTVKTSTAGFDTFPVGGIFELQFPDNSASTGYVWEVVEGKEILYKDFTAQSTVSQLGETLKRISLTGALDSQAVSLDGEEETALSTAVGDEAEQVAGASYPHYFWFQPGKAGDYKITLKYARPWEGGETCAVYSQTIHVVDSDDPIADGAQTSYIFDSFDINPPAGSTVKIIKEANPTTGYFWTVSGEGLTIEEDYKVDNPDLMGSPGQYEWYAAAANPGDYLLKAELKHAGSDEVLSVFEIPLKFV
ncbi:MAG: protease inhibitor I42 family protein [Methanocorpusculum sp.]|nr:protease inhibitor I42 family protein [Methanocorpusculum sp.]